MTPIFNIACLELFRLLGNCKRHLPIPCLGEDWASETPMEIFVDLDRLGQEGGEPSTKRSADAKCTGEEVHDKNATWRHGEYGNHVESGSTC
jgi:hypothetical protein